MKPPLSAATPLEEVFKQLESSREGLSSSEAEARLKKHGKNQLKEEKKTLFKVLLSQFKNPLIYVLFIASLISISIGKTTDFAIILIIILINSAVGFIQEYKAEKSISALKKLTESQSKVLRDNMLITIPSSDLVPGDYQVLHEGDLVTADLRLVKSQGLSVDESSITGESMPVLKDSAAAVEKDAAAFELENSLLTGTLISRGTGEGIITQTGANTYLASIAESAKEPSPETPLTKAISHFAKRYVAIQLLLFLLIGVIGYFQGRSLVDLAYILLAAIVSVVPEGLPLVVTLVMAVGAVSLSRRKALVRSLPSVETLGSITIIASDKTGTMTQGKLTVQDFSTKDEGLLRKIAALCNDAQEKMGDPLDVALAHWIDDFKQIRQNCPRLWSYSFDARLRLMATVNTIDGKETLLIKGALESLKERAPEQDFTEIDRAYEELLDRGLRVLAFGQGVWEGKEDPASWKIEVIGLIGFIDPPKKEVFNAVQKAKQAGLHVIMLTGDHPKTAVAVAQLTGILRKREKGHATGKEIETLSDPQLLELLKKTSVLARILPEHKYRIVKILQSAKELVAVTGDGVNDVPALKAADIGIAMGSGTEAAKGASDMVITDSNLSIIIDAIRNARVIADNLRKVIYYLVSTSQVEIILIALSIFSKLPLPLSAIQILWINIVTDGVQDKMFAFTKEEGNVMERKPRRANRQFFDGGQIFRMFSFGIAMGLVTFFLYFYLLGRYDSLKTVTTIVFTTVIAMQWANGIQAQKEKEPFFKNLKSSLTINPFIYLGLGIGLLLQIIPIYIVPDLFHSTSLSLGELSYPALGFLASFLFVELRKHLERLLPFGA